MNRWWYVAGIELALLLLAIAFAPPPASADEACATVDFAVGEVVKAGGQIVDLVDVPGASFDQVLFVSVDGVIFTGLVRDGCMVDGPRVFAKARPPPAPAGTPT